MKKATRSEKQGSQSHGNFSTSSSAQRTRLLERLQIGPVDTITARRELNIIQPAARIKELKEQGYHIRTQRISMADDQGRNHHGIALYYLTTYAEPAQAEA